MKFVKAEVSVVKFNVEDVLTTSIATCSVPGMPVEECDFES